MSLGDGNTEWDEVLCTVQIHLEKLELILLSALITALI